MVCKKDYYDYRAHIQAGIHKAKIRQNKFEKDIANLCSMMEKAIKQCKKPRRNGKLCKSNGTTRRHKFFKKSEINGKFVKGV